MNKFTMLKSVTLAFLVVAVVLAGAFQAQPVNAAGTELTYGIYNNVDTLDPNVTTFSSVGTILYHVVDPLVWEPTLGTFEAGLASEWSVNADATEYTFKLREGVKFHDGTEFNGDAVKFTFDRIVNPDTKSQTAKSLLGPYKETVVTDKLNITVKFNSPYAPFLDSLANPYLGIISPAAVQKAGADWGTRTVVGTGPYMLQSYTPDSEVVLARFPDYNWGPAFTNHKGQATLEKITFKIIQEPATRLAALESGTVEFIDNVPTQDIARLKEEKKFTVLEKEQPGSGWSLMMNVENPPTDDVAVRKAVAMGIDKEGMIKTVWNGMGKPGCGPLTRPMFGFDPKSCEYLPYNPEEAGKVLDAAGWKLGADGIREKDGKKLVIQHYYRADSFPGADMAAFMKADLKKVGIDVVLNGLAQAGYFDAVRAGKHNSQNWWETGTDPGALVRILFHSSNAGGGTNRNRYKNADMDKLIEQAAGEPNVEKRAALYAQIQKKAADEAIMVFFNDPLILYAHAPELQGIATLGGGNYPYFYAASFK